MTTLKYATAGLAAAFLVSCEPLPVYPPGQQRPYPPQGNRGDDRYQSPDRRYDDTRYDRDPQPQPQPQPPTRDQYPVAERTANPNQVLSPYAPYNVIDVEGFRSGQLAKDPSNGKIFRVP